MTLVLSPEILENHVGILGKTGSGKSNLAKVVAEQLLAAGERVVILDPTGTWYGLRLTRQRKPSPFRIVIFGGAHGDIPIAAHHGAEIAAALARSSTSAIIDTRQMTVKARTQFATELAEALLRLNVGRLRIIVDEAHLFAPQGKVPDPDAGKMLNAWNNLASLGRGVGLVLILISQRPAKLHKDSLTQIETLVAMRLIGPQDRGAFKEWVKESADEVQGTEIVKSLPSLPTGTGWVWSPALDILEKRSFPLAATLDTGKPADVEDVVLGAIDIEAIRAQLGKVEEERKANDPAELRKQIAQLKRDLEARPTEKVVETVERIVEVPVLNGQVERLDQLLTAVRPLLDLTNDAAFGITEAMQEIHAVRTDILAAVGRVNQTPTRGREARAPRGVPAAPARDRGDTAVATLAPAAPRRDPAPAQPPAREGGASLSFGKAERSILGALAGYPSLRLSRWQTAFLAGYHAKTGVFVSAVGALRSAGYVPGEWPLSLTDDGLDAVQSAGIEPINAPPLDAFLDRLSGSKEKGLLHELVPVFPTEIGMDLLASWVSLQPKAERSILEVVLADFPREVPREELADRAGYHPKTGVFVSALGSLRSLGALDGFRIHPNFARLSGLEDGGDFAAELLSR